MKGIHTITLTDAAGETWLTRPGRVELTDSGIIFTFEDSKASRTQHKTRVYLTKEQVKRAHADIRKIVPAGGDLNAYPEKRDALAKKYRVSSATLVLIHRGQHRFQQRKK